MPQLEIACFSRQSALTAASCGVSRIELCAKSSLGGTTPLLSDFESLKENTSTPINIMIRPRGGNFIYTKQDFDIMLAQLESFLSCRHVPDGLVFGLLDDKGFIDVEKCKLILERTRGLPCTFHRAFDEVAEDQMVVQLEVLIKLGFRAVLTSGGKISALEGKAVLAKLVEAAAGRIDIIVGGGVRSGNVEVLRAVTCAEWYHSSAITVPKSEKADSREVDVLIRTLKT